MARKTSPRLLVLQLLCNFVVPIVILSKFSGPAALGPVRALLLALALPVLLELGTVIHSKKINLTSVVAIAGILVTGGLGLLHVSAGWLAVRRAVPYLFFAALLLGAEYTNRSLVTKFTEQLFDIKKLNQALKEQAEVQQFKTVLKIIAYCGAGLCVALAGVNYILTRVIVTSPAASELFNQQYARLRVIGLPALTVPSIIGIVLLIWYLIASVERLTKQDAESFMKLGD